MPDTPRPAPPAATLATVRHQLLHAAVTCANLSPEQLDQFAARLTAPCATTRPPTPALIAARSGHYVPAQDSPNARAAAGTPTTVRPLTATDDRTTSSSTRPSASPRSSKPHSSG
ncbi:DUF6374 family protein [Nocardia thailandica]|uniref:DUF6374 family protein n=1 Tax=Nocardia thailandica TaxID=257275 RepID=UPI003570E6A0